MANLSKTLHVNFYQNRSSIVEVMIKKFWCVFYASQCSNKTIRAVCTRSNKHQTSEHNVVFAQLYSSDSEDMKKTIVSPFLAHRVLFAYEHRL